MIRTTVIVATLFAILPVSAMGQEKEATATYKDFLEWGNRLEGRWVGKITLIADWPGLDKKKGEVVSGHVTYKWIVDKQALEETSFVANGEAKCLHFWDSGSKTIKIVCVTSGGEGVTGVKGSGVLNWRGTGLAWPTAGAQGGFQAQSLRRSLLP